MKLDRLHNDSQAKELEVLSSIIYYHNLSGTFISDVFFWTFFNQNAQTLSFSASIIARLLKNILKMNTGSADETVWTNRKNIATNRSVIRDS